MRDNKVTFEGNDTDKFIEIVNIRIMYLEDVADNELEFEELDLLRHLREVLNEKQ